MSSVRVYAASAEREILRVFAMHEVLVASYGCRQGPHTLTYALRLIQNVRSQLDAALKLGPLIEGSVMDSPVRITYRSGYLYVEIPSPQPIPVQAVNLRGDGLAVPVGMTTSRAVRGIDFANPPTAHLVIVAGTGMGKTTAARSILYGLARQNTPEAVRLAVCTFKPRDWNAFERLPHTLELAVEPKQIVRILRWAKAEVYRRSRQGISSPHYVIVLDDMYNWGKVVDVGDEIGQIASLGRASGISLVISTQKMTAEGVGNNGAAISNISTRLVLGATSGPEASRVTGVKTSGAELLGRYPGDALLIAFSNPVRLACASVADEDVADLAAGRTRPADLLPPWVDLEGGNTNESGQRLLPSLDTVSSEGQPMPARLPKPLTRYDEPTPEQVEEIARIFEETGRSINKTIEICYGAKGAKTLALVNMALEQKGLRRKEEA